MKRLAIFLLILVIAAGAFIAYRMYDERTPDIINKTPDVSTDVETILSAFEKDTAAASRVYMDKIVEIRGRVKNIDTTGAVVLGSEGDPSEVVLGLDRRHLKDHEFLTIGNMAVLQGICSGYSIAEEDPEDMLSSLGTTIQFRSAVVKTDHKH